MSSNLISLKIDSLTQLVECIIDNNVVLRSNRRRIIGMLLEPGLSG